MKLWGSCLVALMLLAGLTSVPAPAAIADDCSRQSDPIPSALPGTPVVYVHGWLGSNAGSSDAQAKLIKSLGGAFPVLGFDYGPSDTTWAADPSISGCLAGYIEKAAAASKAGGGSGKVVAVAHSMGGIGVRAASANTPDLEGLVTIGTPHMGSPLAGGYATFNEWINRLWQGIPTPFPPSGSAASACLAWPRPSGCAAVPYLANGQKIATIAGQIEVKDSLFDLSVLPTSTYDIGDSIVLKSSANGYEGSSPGPAGGTVMGTDTVTCTVTSGQINRQFFYSFAGLGLGVDAVSLQLAEGGTASPQMADAAAALQTMNFPCAHGLLPTNNDVVALASKYVHAMASAAGSGSPQTVQPGAQASSAPSPTDTAGASSGPKWFGLDDDETRAITYDGGQYDMRTATIRTSTYPKSMVYRYQGKLPSDMRQNWVDFALNGKCTAFETGIGISTLALSPSSSATFTVFVDGVQKAQSTLSYYNDPQNLHIDVTGASRLRVQLDFPGFNSTAAVWGSPRIKCSENPSPGP